MTAGRGEGKMQITLNGKRAEVKDGITLAQILDEMQIVPQMVACEVNLTIVRRGDYATTRISEGDQVEILQMIGGG